MHTHLRLHCNIRLVNVLPMFLFFLSCLFPITLVYASDGYFAWAKSIGGSNTEASNGMAVDDSGNIYTTGYFYGTVDFDPGPGVFNLTSNGESDIFICKLDNTGNFVWAKNIGGALIDSGYDIAVDNSGHVYTIGTFQDTVDFDPGAGVYNLTDGRRFFSKLDSNGNFLWAKAIRAQEEEGYVSIRSVALDGAGNVYTTGSFAGTVDFDPGTEVYYLPWSGGDVWQPDGFISKLDSNGNFIWAKAWGSHGSQGIDSGEEWGSKIIVDKSWYVYVLGGDYDGFSISKYNSFGKRVWSKYWYLPKYGDYVNNIDIDDSGYIYTMGWLAGSTIALSYSDDCKLVNASGSLGVFITKYNDEGNCVWARRSIGEVGAKWPSGLSVDESGNVYTIGDFYGTVDFDPGSGVFNITSNGGSDIFVGKMSNKGNFVWVRSMGGKQDDSSENVFADDAGSIYTTGSFSGTADFDPGPPVFSRTSHGEKDIFISKLSKGPAPPFRLSVSVTGKGSIKSNPSGIHCPKNCLEWYQKITPVTLTAIASEGQTFDGWSGGGCSGSGTCSMIIDSNHSVVASFRKKRPLPWALLLLKEGESNDQ